MLCKFLHRIYGRDTRSAQVVNISWSGGWAIVLWLHSQQIVTLKLPNILEQSLTDVMLVAILASMFSIMGLVTKGKRHQVLKFFGLSLGAVFYGILANGFFSAYPPLDMMLAMCLFLVVWFTLGLLYILRCEGFDGTYKR